MCSFFFSVFADSIFGKTCENARRYRNVHYVTSEFAFLRRVARVNYHASTILNDRTAMVESHPMQVKLNKPIYVGCVIMDLSKLLMIKFLYKKLMPVMHRPPQSVLTLNLSDTDSFIFSVTYEANSQRNYYRDLGKLVEHLDVSAYPEQHPLFRANAHIPGFRDMVKRNKGVLGRFKDELAGTNIMTECVCLKPKMYSFQSSNGDGNGSGDVKEHKTCKGIASHVRKNVLTFRNYKEVYDSTNPMRHSMKNIRSRAHRLYIEAVNKTSLSLFEVRTFVLPLSSQLSSLSMEQ